MGLAGNLSNCLIFSNFHCQNFFLILSLGAQNMSSRDYITFLHYLIT